MIHTNNISTEASAGTHSISQGKHKGSKANKSLFSTLLGMLQKGASQKSIQQTVQQDNHKNTGLPTAEGIDKRQAFQQENKSLQHTLSQTSNTENIDKKIKHILQQTENTGSMGKKSTTNKGLQHTLAQNNNAQTINKKLQHNLVQTNETQTVDKNVQHTLAQAKKQHRLLQTGETQASKTLVTDKKITATLTLDTPVNTSEVDANDAIASLQEVQVTPLVINTNKNGSPVDEQQAKQVNPATSQATTSTISPELLAEASSNKQQASQKMERQNPEYLAASTQNIKQNKLGEQPLTIQQSKQIEQHITAQQSNQVNNAIEPTTDGIKTSQAAIAAIQQRTGNQTQQAQATNASTVAATSSFSAVHIVTTDNNTSSQQDLNSNQHDADMSLLDSAKTDNKNAKGLDFQAQLAYKSQRTFTPADTMLEIVKSAKTGNTTLELQLEPAHLGKVQVSIQMDQAKHIQVMFTVDQTASKQALEQQMPQLRLAMAQQGLDLGGCSMQMNQQSGQQQGGNQQASNSATAGNSLDATTLTHSNDEQNTRIGVNLATQGHLSILA